MGAGFLASNRQGAGHGKQGGGFFPDNRDQARLTREQLFVDR